MRRYRPIDRTWPGVAARGAEGGFHVSARPRTWAPGGALAGQTVKRGCGFMCGRPAPPPHCTACRVVPAALPALLQ